jgi:hypothetical protein
MAFILWAIWKAIVMKSTGKTTKMVLSAGLIFLVVFSTRAILADEDCNDTTPPTLEILSPPSGAIIGFWGGTDELCVTVNDYNPCPEGSVVVDLYAPGWDKSLIKILRWYLPCNGGCNGCRSGWTDSVWNGGYDIPDGPVTISVIASDNSGNWIKKTINVTVDNTFPTLEVEGMPGDGDIISGTISFTATASDGYGIKKLTSEVGTDWGGESQTVSASTVTWDTTVLSEGGFFMNVNAFDNAGNCSQKVVYIYIDNTAPTAPAGCQGWSDFSSTTSITSGETYSYSSPFFEWSGATDPEGSGIWRYYSGIEGYYVYYGTDDFADPEVQGTFQSACTYEVPEDAMTLGNTYYLRVKTRDYAGNTSDVYDAFTYTYCGAYISFSLGRVKIKRSGEEEWLTAEKDECLQDGDKVRTGGPNSSAVITFADGSEIKLNEMSFLEMRKVRHCSEIETFWGRIWASITGGCFYVYTPTAAGAVRGTEFTVEVAEEGTSTATVLEGVVEVCDLAETKTVLVVQYQTTTVEPNGVPSDPQSIDPNEIDRWWECVVDSDSDGMDDCWEEQYGLNPDDPADALLDNDGDGTTNLQEYNAGTDPNTFDDYPPPVSSIEICVGRSYDEPNNPNDLTYEFGLEVETDETVELVEFVTPAGKRFSIPNEPRNWSGDICTWYYHEDNAYCWGYEADFPNEANLADYGDGTYTIIVHCQDDSNDQTTVWFGIPETNDPILQPMQKPVLTFPMHNSVTTSPVTFTWEPCTDANATSNWFWLGLEKQDANEEYVDIELPMSATSSDPITLSEGTWEAELCFENCYDFNNVDGIGVEIGKYIENDSLFTVTNPADLNRNGIVNFQDFAIFALAWLTEPGDAQWNPACDISDPNDNVIDMMDVDVFTDNWLLGAE